MARTCRWGTDRIAADYLAHRLAERVEVVILPTVTYGYYPHVTAFPGSTHLEADTFAATVKEIILSIVWHGPRRSYMDEHRRQPPARSVENVLRL